MALPRILVLLFVCLFSLTALSGQESFFEKADTFHQGRFWTISGFTAVAYTGTVIGLNELWYKGFERSGFHTFDDWGEWNQMDKAGHAFTSYFETSYVYDFARWTGMKDRSALWTAVSLGTLFQGTVEMLDAYSEAWGFSFGDVAFNTAGSALFAGQQLAWNEQRMVLKVSNRFPTYPEREIRNGDYTGFLSERTDELYGGAIPSRLLKDYNGQTIWLSVNPKSFFPESKWPSFLNIAIGYGSENLFGARSNSWEDDGVLLSLPESEFPRYRQIYISPDIDLSRLKVKKPFWRMLLKGLNVFKIPAPALEFNLGRGMKFKPLYF
ncbi:MAG: DUF2279 domain-containing protein [Saprospiraceae bacterium]|nr:DUF2279 domain-containing protein [Saprospiraceae bacterium]